MDNMKPLKFEQVEKFLQGCSMPLWDDGRQISGQQVLEFVRNQNTKMIRLALAVADKFIEKDNET